MRDAAWAAALLAVDPDGLGGALLRGRPGPERDAWLGLHAMLLPSGTSRCRLPPRPGDEALTGGLDLVGALAAGRPVHRVGLLEASAGGVVILPMAERAGAALAVRLLAGMKRHGFALLALDESEGEEAPPAALADRLAFRLELDARVPNGGVNAAEVARARRRLSKVDAPEEVVEALIGVALAAGITSLRAPWLALRAAYAAAALAGRSIPAEEDVALAVRLVLGPRATVLPPMPEEAPAPEAEPPPPEQRSEAPPEEITTEAQQASLPPHLLTALAQAARLGVRATAGRTGAERVSLRRGRPIGAVAGEPRDGARLALLDTLRAAAPWQRLRPPPLRGRLSIRRSDFRIIRHREASEATAIFVLDASGSAALHRLGEAKGAVELLLADCYARRDRVAVVAFRGAGAETLLPPTHSLSRAKRALAGLPGGGASPLAAGLEEGARLARLERRAGRTPLLVLLTDGRANLSRDGMRGREAAEADALAVAQGLLADRLPLLVVDTGPRPQPFAAALAAGAGGRCLPLPQARAEALAQAVRSAA
jgi:magnesium chelatase subunit D